MVLLGMCKVLYALVRAASRLKGLWPLSPFTNSHTSLSASTFAANVYLPDTGTSISAKAMRSSSTRFVFACLLLFILVFLSNVAKEFKLLSQAARINGVDYTWMILQGLGSGTKASCIWQQLTQLALKRYGHP